MSEALRSSLCIPEFHILDPVSDTATPTAEDMCTGSGDRDKHRLVTCAYRPDAQVFGPGPYPTVVAVYGGPHVQR